ncbi:MAG: hypothetical protein ACT4O0_13160 [Pseudonocardia sp.]
MTAPAFARASETRSLVVLAATVAVLEAVDLVAKGWATGALTVLAASIWMYYGR